MKDDGKHEKFDLDNLPNPNADEDEDEDFSTKDDYKQQLLKAYMKGDYETTRNVLRIS